MNYYSARTEALVRKYLPDASQELILKLSEALAEAMYGASKEAMLTEVDSCLHIVKHCSVSPDYASAILEGAYLMRGVIENKLRAYKDNEKKAGKA